MGTMRAVVAQTPGGPVVLAHVDMPIPAKSTAEFLIRAGGFAHPAPVSSD